MTKENINKIKDKMEFSLKYLGDSFKSVEKIKYDFISAHMIIEMIMELVAFGRSNEINTWIAFAEKYYLKCDSDEKLTQYTSSQIKLYFAYILSIAKNNPRKDLIYDYSLIEEDYMKKHYELNKVNIREYEELVLVMMAANRYKEATFYCKRILGLKERRIIRLILCYLEINESCGDKGIIINECKKILNKIQPIICDVLTEGFLYYHLYFIGMLNVTSSEMIFESMIYGIQ